MRERKLGRTQSRALGLLAKNNGRWRPYCGWTLSTEGEGTTRRILDSLIKYQVVEKQDSEWYVITAKGKELTDR